LCDGGPSSKCDVGAKQHQLGQRRDVDRTHSLKQRSRKNALINSAHDAQELMRRVTRALLSMCPVSTACGSRALRFTHGDYEAIKKRLTGRAPGVTTASQFCYFNKISFRAIMRLYFGRSTAQRSGNVGIQDESNFRDRII